MATQLLAPGLTAASTSDITIAAGDSVLIGIFSSTPGNLPATGDFVIEYITPGAPNIIGYLNNANRSILLNAPGTYRVRRVEYVGHPFGVFQG